MRPVSPRDAARSSAVLLELAALVLCGCPHHAVATVDASTATPDAAARRGSHARRHHHARASARTAASAANDTAATPSATTTTLGDPGRSSADDFALGGPSDENDDPGSDPAPRQRPRVTETGPMLPEALGHATGTTFDMTGTTTGGTMGLEPAQITHGMNPLLGRLARCADATSDDHGHGPHGRVGVRLRIHANGSPVAAQVTGGGGGAEFVTCVRRVVASARFEAFGGPDVFASWGFDVD